MDMAEVTSKHQVTLPKTIVEMYDIQPGDHIDWVAAGDVICVIPSGKQTVSEDLESRVHLFDQATERIARRSKRIRIQPSKRRGWSRDELYTRGHSR